MADTPPPSVHEFRVYRHLHCKTETVIAGQAFEVASNPLSSMTRTWCNTCEAHFPIDDYEWADTGEKISDYYIRHSARATKLERFLCSKVFLILCGIVGFIAGGIGGYFLFRNNELWLQIFMIPFTGVVALIILCSVICLPLEKLILKRVCGVSDTRVLR